MPQRPTLDEWTDGISMGGWEYALGLPQVRGDQPTKDEGLVIADDSRHVDASGGDPTQAIKPTGLDYSFPFSLNSMRLSAAFMD